MQMKTISLQNGILINFVAVGLLMCTLDFDLLVCDLPHRLKRGLLEAHESESESRPDAAAALGYPQYPGPDRDRITDALVDATSARLPGSSAVVPTTMITTPGDVSSHRMSTVNDPSAQGSIGPRNNVAILTGTVTETHVVMAATQAASASRDVASSSLLLPMALSVLLV